MHVSRQPWRPWLETVTRDFVLSARRLPACPFRSVPIHYPLSTVSTTYFSPRSRPAHDAAMVNLTMNFQLQFSTVQMTNSNHSFCTLNKDGTSFFFTVNTVAKSINDLKHVDFLWKSVYWSLQRILHARFGCRDSDISGYPSPRITRTQKRAK